MKKYIHLIALGVILVCQNLSAYRYTFSNHTEQPLLVGIKLCCAFENLIYKLVEPHTMITFVHGEDFPMEKFGYCLQSLSYVKNLTIRNITHPQSAPWTEINTTWLKNAAYDTIIEFAQSLGEGSEKAGKAIAKLAMAVGTTSATGGAAAPVASAAATMKAAASTISAPAESTTTSTNPKVSIFGKITGGLAKLISITTCRDRHWDIYEDDNGKIVFISKIQQ